MLCAMPGMREEPASSCARYSDRLVFEDEVGVWAYLPPRKKLMPIATTLSIIATVDSHPSQ